MVNIFMLNLLIFRYQWTVNEISDFRSTSEIILIAGQFLTLPLLGWLQLPDANIICFILFTAFVRHMIDGK